MQNKTLCKRTIEFDVRNSLLACDRDVDSYFGLLSELFSLFCLKLYHVALNDLVNYKYHINNNRNWPIY